MVEKWEKITVAFAGLDSSTKGVTLYAWVHKGKERRILKNGAGIEADI